MQAFRAELVALQQTQGISLGSVQISEPMTNVLKVSVVKAPLNLKALARLATKHDLRWHLTLQTTGSAEEDEISHAVVTLKQQSDVYEDDKETKHDTVALESNSDRVRKISSTIQLPPHRPDNFVVTVVQMPSSEWLSYKLGPGSGSHKLMFADEMLHSMLRHDFVSQVHLYSSCFCIEIPHDRPRKRRAHPDAAAGPGAKRARVDTF